MTDIVERFTDDDLARLRRLNIIDHNTLGKRAVDEIERLRAELVKCGKENCMGHQADGYVSWVREERLIEAQAEIERLRAELRQITDRMADVAIENTLLREGSDAAKDEIERLRNLVLVSGRLREITLRMVAALFSESIHETYSREDIVSIVEDMLGKEG